jgi:hypothetical protein
MEHCHMSRSKPTAPVAEPTPTDAEIVAMVDAGGVTAEHNGETVDVVAIDLDGAPVAEPTRVRELIDVPVLALGAPGTIATQAVDGSWYAALPGDA